MVASAWHDLLRRFRRILRKFETERTEQASTWTLTVRLAQDELDGGWVAEVLELPGCMSQGETKDEAIENVMTAFSEVMAVRVEGQQPERADGDSSDAEVRRVALCVS